MLKPAISSSATQQRSTSAHQHRRTAAQEHSKLYAKACHIQQHSSCCSYTSCYAQGNTSALQCTLYNTKILNKNPVLIYLAVLHSSKPFHTHPETRIVDQKQNTPPEILCQNLPDNTQHSKLYRLPLITPQRGAQIQIIRILSRRRYLHENPDLLINC